MWSMYLMPVPLRGLTPLSIEWVEAVDELPESELKDQIVTWPHAAVHDGLNYVFVEMHPEANNPVDLSTSEYETVNQLVVIIANALFAEDRSRAIHLTKVQAIALYNSPAWRLWCGRYDNKDALEVDHKLFFGSGIDDSQSLDTLINNAKNNLKSLLT